MQAIPVARTANLQLFTDALKRIGTPVDRELRRDRLPTLLDEVPETYVPLDRAVVFLHRMERREGIGDLGTVALGREAFEGLSERLLRSVRNAPTLYARFLNLGATVMVENTHLRLSLKPEDDRTRVCLNLRGVPPDQDCRHSEWLQINTLVEIVRDAIGPRFAPLELTVRSSRPVWGSIRQRFPGAHLRTGCSETSIVLPSLLLSEIRSMAGEASPSAEIEQVDISPSFAVEDLGTSLKLALRSYLADGYPDVHLAADIAGTSVRTLQRRLAKLGLDYSTLVRETRIEAAGELITQADASVLDVAYAVGYEDPSNFARAFRQVTGVSPSGYRAQRNAEGQGLASKPGR